MSYAGSFNGFTFGQGPISAGAPYASVASLTGWRASSANLATTEGATFNWEAQPRRGPGEPRLVLNLHAETPALLAGLIDDVMAAFDPSAVAMPLTIDDWSKWVQVKTCTPDTQPEWPGPERTTTCTIQFTAAEQVLYSEQTSARSWVDGVTGPLGYDSFRVGNDGFLVGDARMALELRLTAHGTVTDPNIKMSHDDGTFEQITFQGLTMTGGQVLTFGADRLPRVGSQIVSGYVRSLTEAGIVSRAPRWWLLHPCDLTDSGDEGNRMIVQVPSGNFTGFVKVRSTKR